MQATHLLDLQNVTKTYHMGDVEFPVLHGITFSVDAGEFVSVLGPSGSGKSTLMNIIGCLDVADDGTYTIGRRAVTGLSERDMAKLRNRDIGFVFQSFQLLPRISALENVMLPLIYAKVPRKQRILLVWDSLTRPTISPANYRAVSSSALPLRAHWSHARALSLQTSRRVHLTVPRVRKLWIFSAHSTRRASPLL